MGDIQIEEDFLPSGIHIVTLRVHSPDGELKHESVTHNSRVNTGAALMVSLMFDPATLNNTNPGALPFIYVGLNTSSTAIVSTLTAATFTATEITTTNLNRKQVTYGSYASPGGTLNANATATLSASWTVPAATSGTIASIGLYNGPTLATAKLGLATVLGAPVPYAATDVISLAWGLAQ